METKKLNPKQPIMNDSEIIELYWRRDERAINETDVKYRRYLYRVAKNILNSAQDCEESLNDTYFITWNKIPPAKPKAFQTFLSKITRDVSIDKYRKNAAEKRIPAELTASLDELDDTMAFEVSAEESFIVNQLSVILNSYLRELPKRSVFIFVSRYYYADSIETIAKMLKVSESTVFRDLAKIRKGLCDRIEAMGYKI